MDEEAFIKATGDGLNRYLKSFSVRFGPDQEARFDGIQNDDAAAWTLRSFETNQGYVAALAMRAEKREYDCANWLRFKRRESIPV